MRIDELQTYTLMKKHVLSVIACVFAGILTASAQMDNLANLSAEWVRTPARNAALDAGDIAVYNPAGLVRLNDGFTINVGNQSLFRKPTHSYDFGMGMGTQTFTQDGSDAFLPNLYVSYKKNHLALFSGIFVAGGGATANYPTGSVTTDLIGLQAAMSTQGAYTYAGSQYLKASSMYLTSTLGVSYALNERVSVAAAGRFLNAKNTTKAGMTLTQSPYDLPDQPLALNTEDKASGFGGVIAVMMKAAPRLNVTMRYETAVKLDFTTHTTTDDFGATVDGSKSRRDLPAVFALGTAYAASEKVKVYGDFNYFFQTAANWGNSGPATEGKSWSEMAGNAYAVTLATTFQVGTKTLFSVGGGYTDFMYNDMAGYYTKAGAYETVYNDNINLNTGFSYRLTKACTVTAAYMHVMYNDATIKALNAQPLDVNVKTSSKIDELAVGVNLQF